MTVLFLGLLFFVNLLSCHICIPFKTISLNRVLFLMILEIRSYFFFALNALLLQMFLQSSLLSSIFLEL